MRIVVLVKQVPDTEEERNFDLPTGLLDRTGGGVTTDEINERALEVALTHKEANKGTEVVVLTMGPASAEQTLKKCLQMGADSGVHVLDESLSGADAVQTAQVLAAAIKKTGFDFVIAGNESTDGRGGVVPAMVSELLGLPLLGSLNSLQIGAGTVTGERREESGSSSIHSSLPAVATVTESFAEARFPTFKGILSAKRKSVARLDLSELELEPTTVPRTRSKVLAVTKRPPRQAGVKIIDAGDAGVQLAEYLANSRLI